MEFVEQKGKFVKHCPCTPEAVSCGYYNLNMHTGCPYECTYCILQTYLESKKPVFFTNLGDMRKELVHMAATQRFLRIGTGELSDSLALDHRSGYSHKILDIFRAFPQVIFEFKTKSANIDSLLSYPQVLPNVVISWSLNPQAIITNEEHHAPTLKERLQAMSRVWEQGYRVGIHFDPLIYIKDWKNHYNELIAAIAQTIPPQALAWWSIGALRFPYSLREHIFKFKDSRLFEGELIKGYDNKYRYYKPLRVEMFAHVIGQIHNRLSTLVPLYFCMEDEEVWRELLPNIEPREDAVNRYLYDSVIT